METNNQLENTSPNPTQIQEVANPIHNQRGTFPIILGVLVLLLVVGGGGYYVGMMNGKSKTTQTAQTPIHTDSSLGKQSPYSQPTVASTSSPLPSPKAGFQQFTNSNLNYGFNYRASDSLYQCPDIPCLSISRISLRVEVLDSYDMNLNDLKSTLMESDLFCSADGPGGSISCRNDKVDDYTNSLGFKGYKVSRTKTVTGTGAGFPAGNYKDIVYVYLLPEIKKGPGVSDYAAVMFAVDNPSQGNLSELNIIGDSYFTF